MGFCHKGWYGWDMGKPSARELELRERREAAIAAEEARVRREEERRAHYEGKRRAEAVTKINGVCDENHLASVTKIIEGKKRGRGRPTLLGSPMTGAERTRRYRARLKARGKAEGR